MQVKLAVKRGFCFGVEGAIELAQATLDKMPGQTLYALGPLIHNNEVTDRLAQKGLKISPLEDIPDGATVLVRSHGINPKVYQALRDRELQIVDATCVLVKKAQHVVAQLHQEGYQVIMVGDPDHAEVKGVVGYAPNVICVQKPEEVTNIPRFARLGIVAQTTHSPEFVSRVIQALIAEVPFREIKIVNTLCLEVSRRQEAALALAREVDVMFVLGGLHSANTREIARLVREKARVNVHHLETWAEFRPEMVHGKKTAGVTAGASTPEWVIQEFAEKLQAIEPSA